MLTFGSLFAGIGGIDCGLEAAGMRCAWQVELDPFCQSVLRDRWPGVPKHGDVKTFRPDATHRVDVIAGGFPCQPFSSSGRRRGTSDPRWLWPEYARIVATLRPRYVLVENVPDLLHLAFDSVLRSLAAIGYDAEWDCLAASQFGASHRRKRLFVVAYPAGTRKRLLRNIIQHHCEQPWGAMGAMGSQWRGANDLLELTNAPFVGGDRWPQPLIHCLDDGIPTQWGAWLKGLGNSVYVPLITAIGKAIVEDSES